MANVFKTAITQGQTQIGLWLGLADGYSAEICAGAGFDWLLIDGEHAPNDLRTILEQLRAIAPYPSAPVVRPVDKDPAKIKQLLDIGTPTLLVPMVETAEEAEALVAATRYPPKGIRGVGTALARASGWNRDGGYLGRADEDICLLVQVENREGLRNLNAIASVEGVDGVFIGPADLAGALGHLGNPAHPEVQAIIADALGTIANLGKAPGILSATPEMSRTYLDAGALFVAVGVDTVLLARATSALAASYKEAIDVLGKSNGAY
ncbi:4-hydroxy-2-oxoheptanedioate aldolase [Rhodospirillum sp. A1_3_36]|uniref:4-hydroxy-2-oxoheptanedioate aldolase n=1 Tax=Rhodospirillum sp. A1_3_36 TaxID=3391666 RepID=UPI0039A42823